MILLCGRVGTLQVGFVVVLERVLWFFDLVALGCGGFGFWLGFLVDEVCGGLEAGIRCGGLSW